MTGRRERVRLSSEEQAARNQQIRLERAKGHSFATIAARHELSERQIRNIWEERKTLSYPDAGEEPRRLLQDEIDFLDALLSECAERGELSDNEAIWLGSVKARLAIRARRVELMQLGGRLPRGPEQLEMQRELAELLDHLVAVLTRHNVPGPVFDELVALAERTRETAESTLSYPPLQAIAAPPRGPEKEPER